jgi:hypothetical protein
VADEHDRAVGAGLDHRVQVGREVLDGAACTVRDVGSSVRALVHEHHADLPAQGEPLVVPRVDGADDAVHEHDRRQVRRFQVGLVDLDVDADAIGRHDLLGGRVHRAERDIFTAAELAALVLPVVEDLRRDASGNEGSSSGRDLRGRSHRAPR